MKIRFYVLLMILFSYKAAATPFAYRCESEKVISFQALPCREPDNSIQKKIEQNKIDACIESVKHEQHEAVYHSGNNAIRIDPYHEKIEACYNL